MIALIPALTSAPTIPNTVRKPAAAAKAGCDGPGDPEQPWPGRSGAGGDRVRYQACMPRANATATELETGDRGQGLLLTPALRYEMLQRQAASVHARKAVRAQPPAAPAASTAAKPGQWRHHPWPERGVRLLSGRSAEWQGGDVVASMSSAFAAASDDEVDTGAFGCLPLAQVADLGGHRQSGPLQRLDERPVWAEADGCARRVACDDGVELCWLLGYSRSQQIDHERLVRRRGNRRLLGDPLGPWRLARRRSCGGDLLGKRRLQGSRRPRRPSGGETTGPAD